MRGEEQSRMRRRSFTATSLPSSYKVCLGWQMAVTARSATLHLVPKPSPQILPKKACVLSPIFSPHPALFPPSPPSPMVSPLTRSFLLSSLPPPPHPPTARRDNLPHPDLPRLLPLPHQSLESVHPQPDAEADGRFPAGAEPGTARERGAGEEDGEWADV
jgi:hypothetical protein